MHLARFQLPSRDWILCAVLSRHVTRLRSVSNMTYEVGGTSMCRARRPPMKKADLYWPRS
jgi:hypothetical protein